MEPTYSQAGSYISIAGLIVLILTHFGINATADQIGAIISGAALLYGIIHQAISTKNLAISTGAYPKKK